MRRMGDTTREWETLIEFRWGVAWIGHYQIENSIAARTWALIFAMAFAQEIVIALMEPYFNLKIRQQPL